MNTRNYKHLLYIQKNFFSTINGNCVKFTSRFNQIKIPINNQLGVVYFNNDETINLLKDKIKSVDDEFIQSIVIRELDSNKVITDDFKVVDIIDKPIEIFINNYYSIKHFPSINQLINANANCKDTEIMDPIKNYFYLNYMKELNNKEKLISELNNLKVLYEKLYNEYQKSENLVEKNITRVRNRFMNIGILFFTLHLIVFYLLIYQISSWDEIEPYTFVVGNIYAIIGLAFYVFYMKRLDLSFAFTKKFSNHYLKKFRFIYSSNPIEKKFFRSEIDEINHFMNIIAKIKH